MNRSFKSYIICWAILMSAYNIIVFIAPVKIWRTEKYTELFWIGCIFIIITFVLQFCLTCMSFKGEALQQLIYHLPILSLSLKVIAVMFVCGSAFTVIPFLPECIGAAICLVILTLYGFPIIRAKVVVGLVSDIDKKVKAKTVFIRSLTIDAENLMARAKSDVAKAECKKVYEAIRYSDPMSNKALSDCEMNITLKFTEFTEAVESGDDEKTAELAKMLAFLAEDRNKKCELIK